MELTRLESRKTRYFNERKLRKHITILAVFVISICCGSSAYTSKFTTAGEYLDFINKQYEHIKKDMWAYTKAVAHNKSVKKIEHKRQDLLETLVKTKTNVEELPAWEGDQSYRDSVIAYLDISLSVLQEDYETILNMEDIANDSYDKMEEYLFAQEQATLKQTEAILKVTNGQQAFANKFNIKLIESHDRMTKRLTDATEVFRHYNQVYLIFFKSYKNESYLFEAYKSHDLEGMKIYQEILLTEAEEGLTKLQQLPKFEGNEKLISACQTMLEFYVMEASEDLNHIRNYYEMHKSFNSVKNDIELLTVEERTSIHIEEYNNALNKLKSSMAVYNETNQRLASKRTAHINIWNLSAQEFTDDQVAKW